MSVAGQRPRGILIVVDDGDDEGIGVASCERPVVASTTLSQPCPAAVDRERRHKDHVGGGDPLEADPRALAAVRS